MARRGIISVPIVPSMDQQAPPRVLGAVHQKDWDRYKLDGGLLHIYTPRRGGTELPGMVLVELTERPTKNAVHSTVQRKPPISTPAEAKRRGDF